MVFFSITHENGRPGTTGGVREPVLCPEALFTPQLYIETEFERTTQTFEKVEHFSDHHVLGRMDITSFQRVTCSHIRITSILDTLSEPAQTGSNGKIPFRRSLNADHPVASVIFDL